MSFEIPSPYTWDSSFDVKHGELNDQHKGLFDLIEALAHDQKNADKLNALVSAVKKHFDTEEEIQTKAHLLDDSHKAKHEKFLADVAAVTEINDDVINFLKQWLVNHIKASDIPDYAGKL